MNAHGEPIRFVPGKILLFLEPGPEADRDPKGHISKQAIDDLRELLRQIAPDHKLADDPFNLPPGNQPQPDVGQPRLDTNLQVIFPDGQHLVQALNLEPWRPNLNLRAQNRLPLRRAAEATEAVVNALNVERERRSGSLLIGGGGDDALAAKQGYKVLEITPDMLVSGLDDGWGDGSPEGDPVPVGVRLQFSGNRNAALTGILVANGKGPYDPTTNGSGIKVAILDTWPTKPGGALPPHRAAIKDGYDHTVTAGHANARLRSWAGEPPTPIDFHFDDLVVGHILTGYSGYVECDLEWKRVEDVKDHGLFVADIIQDLAPNAELGVFRILDDHGVALGISHVLRGVIAARLWANGAPLVINMSWGLDPTTPPGLERALTELFNTAIQDVLAIAAAGNDSCRIPPEGKPVRIEGPRLPAKINPKPPGPPPPPINVISVSSWEPMPVTPPVWTFSSFSNDDDRTVPVDNGIGALGRNVVGLYSTHPVKIVDPAGTPDRPNDHGWVVWSGSSIATAVVSGVAACLWSQLGAAAKQDVAKCILNPGGTNQFINLVQ